MSTRFILPLADVGNGISPSDGAKLFFFITGTSTDKDTFSDQAGTLNTNPVIADGDGVFPEIWIDGSYKVRLTDKNDVQAWEEDPIIGGTGSAATPVVFNTVADLIAGTAADSSKTTLIVGQRAKVNGNLSIADGGENDYIIVAGSTGTDDGGSFIDLDSGLQAKGLFPGNRANARQFGCDGVATTPQHTQLQAMFTFAGSSSTVSRVEGIRDDVYFVDATLRTPARTQYMGMGAFIETDVANFQRGTTPGVAAVMAPENADITDGSIVDEDIEIAYWKFKSGSDNDVLSTLYVSNTNNFNTHHNSFENLTSDQPVLAHIDMHHTNTNSVNVVSDMSNSSASLTFGTCVLVRNANSLIPSDNIVFRDIFLFKNSPTATDELMFVGGGDGVVTNVVLDNVTFESGNVDNSSAQLTIYPFTDGGAITTSDIKYVKVINCHHIVPASVDIALLLGISTDTKEVRHVIVDNCTYALNGNTAIQMQSPVSHTTISNCSAESATGTQSSFCIATSAVIDDCFALVTGNTLEGDYTTMFAGNYVENNKECDSCDVFAKDARSTINNTVKEVRHNLTNDTKFGGRVTGNTATMDNKVTLSPDIPYVFYAPHDKESDIQHNNITFKSNGFKMLFTLAVAGSAGKVNLDHNNFVKDGATDAPRMDLGTTPKELKSSSNNNFYGVSTNYAPDPVTPNFVDFGVPGYIAALGHVTFFNDVAVGTAVDIAEIRVLGTRLKLQADVVTN